MPPPIEVCPCQWVASLPELQSMIQRLEAVEMLAVDVEHHHLHSYLGFVCLLQLSTGKSCVLAMHTVQQLFACCAFFAAAIQ